MYARGKMVNEGGKEWDGEREWNGNAWLMRISRVDSVRGM